MSEQNFQNPTDFVTYVNKSLRTPGSWYWFTGTVNGKAVSLKGYNTWLQIFKIDGVDYSSPMDMKVKDFKEWLIKPFN